MGSFRSLGCLTALVLLAGVAFVTRDSWRPLLRSRAESDAVWAPVTPQGAAVTRRAVASLASPKGPAYVSVTGADFAAYALNGMAPAGAQAAVLDDRLHVRTRVEFRGDSQTVELVGTVSVPRPGVGEFRASEVKVGGVPMPAAVLSRIFHKADSATVGLPPAVGNVRVASGHITLYKKTP